MVLKLNVYVFSGLLSLSMLWSVVPFEVQVLGSSCSLLSSVLLFRYNYHINSSLREDKFGINDALSSVNRNCRGCRRTYWDLILVYEEFSVLKTLNILMAIALKNLEHFDIGRGLMTFEDFFNSV